MRIILLIACAGVALAQTPLTEETIRRATRLQEAGDLDGAVRTLTGLLAEPETRGFDSAIIATIHSNLATVYQDLGDVFRSEQAYAMARDLLSGRLNDPVCRILWFRTTNSMASMYLETGETGKAERLIRAMQEVEVPEGEDLTRFRGTLASLHMVRGRAKEADKWFLVALEYWQNQGNSKEMAVVLNNRALLALHRGDTAAAARMLEEALRLSRQALEDNHPSVLKAVANYAYALLACRRDREAAALLEPALAASPKSGATPVTAYLTTLYAQALRATGRKEEAKRVKKEADRMHASLAPSERSRHTVDVLDLLQKR